MRRNILLWRQKRTELPILNMDFAIEKKNSNAVRQTKHSVTGSFCTYGGSIGFFFPLFLTAWDLDANRAWAYEVSVYRTNMAARYDCTIVIWKGVLKTVKNNTVFMWCNPGCPATAPVIFIGVLRLKKRSPKRKHREKDCEKATDSKVYACSDTDLAEVLFYYIMFGDKKWGSFEWDLSRFL